MVLFAQFGRGKELTKRGRPYS
ncbi:hypothetical protein [Pontibaca salina]